MIIDLEGAERPPLELGYDVCIAGAGDTFNGGYLCASLGELSIKERLVIANAATAFFVTNATAPTKKALIAQVEKASDK